MKYYFTVAGMGIEKGVICIGCIQSFIGYLSDNTGVISVSFSSPNKNFVMDAVFDSRKKAEKAVKKSLEQAGEKLNKDFELVSMYTEEIA